MRTRSIVVYSVLRLAVFLVPFALMMLMPIFQSLWWLAAIFAAVIGWSLSILLLRRPLADVSTSLQSGPSRRRASRGPTVGEQDAAAEDSLIDARTEGDARDADTTGTSADVGPAQERGKDQGTD